MAGSLTGRRNVSVCGTSESLLAVFQRFVLRSRYADASVVAYLDLATPNMSAAMQPEYFAALAQYFGIVLNKNFDMEP
jgi:hypothetical protein